MGRRGGGGQRCDVAAPHLKEQLDCVNDALGQTGDGLRVAVSPPAAAARPGSPPVNLRAASGRAHLAGLAPSEAAAGHQDHARAGVEHERLPAKLAPSH